MSISFNQIPIDLRVPGVYAEIDNSRALKGLPGMPVKILVLGQRLAAGTVAEGVPTQVLDVAAAEEYFGRGSMLHLMFRALKKANNFTETVAIALDDLGAGVAATGTLTFTGVPTQAGTLNLYIAGQRVRVGVITTDAVADVASNVAAAVNAATDMPVTAGAALGVVTLTARHKGESGNDIDLRLNYQLDEKTPAGLVLTIAAMGSVVAGTGNPDIATAIAAFGSDWYTDIAMPWTDAANLAALESELAARFGPLQMMDGHAYAAARGTHGGLTTLGNSRNSPHLSVIGADSSPTHPWAWAATLCGVCAFHAKIDPARPFQTLVLNSILPPAIDKRFTLEERNLLLHDGIATFTVDDGGLVHIERAITTYETNAGGVDDPSYLDLNTLKTLAYLRYSVRARILTRYPRHKLADDGTNYGAGQAIVTPSVLKMELVALFKDWEDAGLAEGIEQFKTSLIIERDAGDPNRVNAIIPPDLINQFRVFAAKIQFGL
ncbi:MAG: phage tail protein [Rhodospirillaceae bacterium]|nr:MAG: phage tail protein [Rhodospirillaceae bacterium]